MSRLICAAMVGIIVGTLATHTAAQDKAVRIDRPSGTHPSKQSADQRYRIIYPPDFSSDNKLTPVVYALHGYGGDMKGMEMTWSEPCARVGAILIVMQGSQVRDGGGFAWSGPEDAGAMIDVARKALQRAHPMSQFAPRVLTGMSQGTFAAYALALRYGQTYRRLIPVSGMFKATSLELSKPLTPDEEKAMRRWRVYIMVGVRDKQELVSNNGWVASEINRVGGAVKAPFMEKRDPSWGMYQTLGHEFPGKGAERTEELLRALRFVLQPDKSDEANWESVDRDWASKAKWMQPDDPRGPEKKSAPRPAESGNR